MIDSSLYQALAYGPAKLYELGVRTRIALYHSGYLHPVRLRAPVISVGNLSVGGTGKTPFVSFTARFLQAEGHQVAVLSRGYRRKSRGRIEVSNEKTILSSASDAGDEPMMLAMSCPGVRVIVDKDRAAAGKWIETNADISAFVLDDAYQHLALARDLNLVLIDATDPLANGRLLPLGRLREPITSLRRADAVIVTRAEEPFDQNAVKELVTRYCRPETPVFYAYHDLVNLRRLDQTGNVKPSSLSHRPVATLSGIARPDRFTADLQHLGMQVVLKREFRDHHRYRDEEIKEALESAHAVGAEAVLTTEKDAMNLGQLAPLKTTLPVYAVQIEFRCEGEVALKALILRAVVGKTRRQ